MFTCFLAFKLSAQKGYTVSLDLTGFKNGTRFYLENMDLGNVTDSIQLIDGKGKFTGYVKEPAGARIWTIDHKYLILELENANIQVKGNYQDFGYAAIEGSELNDDWTKSRDYLRNSHTKRDSLMHYFVQINGTNTDLEKTVLQQVQTIDHEIIHYRISLIKSLKPSYFTIKELFFLRNDLSIDSLQQLFALFPPSLQKTKYGDVISTYVSTSKIPVSGDRFTDIEGTDAQGGKHKLSDYKGKYVLLEFWASWCTPCVSEIPTLKKSYQVFKDKGFEIYSFSIDSNNESWKRAVKKYQTPWVNVTDNQGSYSVVAAKYGVRAIPKNYLISPEGVIVAVDLRGEALYDTLQELIR